MKEKIALKVTDKDNVATIFADDITDGSAVTVLDKRGGRTEYTVKGAVPYGHKIALAPIHVGEHIIKYGEAIGMATREIAPGEYVHVHNLDSMRGRGDWEKED